MLCLQVDWLLNQTEIIIFFFWSESMLLYVCSEMHKLKSFSYLHFVLYEIAWFWFDT